MKKGKESFYCKYIKRVLDIFCSLVAMLVFCWLYAIIAILVRVKLGVPVIFKQERIGRDNKPFMLYKFRSMNNMLDSNGNLLPDKERMTRFGSILRSLSLDELPEAWNILKGDMSVIGPRPLPSNYIPYYTAAERRRHDVRPGLSGLAQVDGRNFITWTEKFSLDLKYIENCSLFSDVLIIFKTVFRMIQSKNVMDIRALNKDENGKMWVMYNGEKRYVSQPLDIERSVSDATRNRQ